MTKNPLKRHLNRAAKIVTDETTLEDVVKYLEMALDIEESEEQIKRGEVYTHEEIKERGKRWLA